MRKFMFAAAAPVVLAAVLAGCTPAAPAEPPSPFAGHSGNYQGDMAITYGELQAAATISQPIPDACSVQFTSPDSLQGLLFVYGRDSVDVSYRGLSFGFDPGSVPERAVAEIAVRALAHSMEGDGVAIAQGEGGATLSGTVGAGQYSLQLDAASNAPVKLLLPAADLQIEFVNFQFFD